MENCRFEFRCAEGSEKPAIWFFLKDRYVQVYPYELFHSIWDGYKRRAFCSNVYLQVDIYENVVRADFYDYNTGYYQIEYDRNTFIDSAITSLQDMCSHILNGGETNYSQKFTINHIEKLREGLDNFVIPKKSYNQIHPEKINIEKFSFSFIEPYGYDTEYEITIGNKVYRSFLSDWGTDFNTIRMQMESFAMTCIGEINIEINCEDDPTIMVLRKYAYSQDEGGVTKLTIIPDGFDEGPITCGWCDHKEFLISLYLGLLRLCIVETDRYDFDYFGGSWNEFRLATYNKLQSCIIENYILGKTEDDYSYLPRQRVINSVEDMMEDYNNLCITLNNRLHKKEHK